MASEHVNLIPRKPKRKPSAAVKSRRALVAQMLARRVTQIKIAEALKVSRGTIVKDVRAIEDEWREDMLANITTIKARELAELSVVEGEAWQGFQRSLDKGKAVGDSKWLKLVLDCKRRRSDLLGLDAPIEIRDVSNTKELREMTDEELEAYEQKLLMEGASRSTVH